VIEGREKYMVIGGSERERHKNTKKRAGSGEERTRLVVKMRKVCGGS